MARLARGCVAGWPHLVVQRVQEGQQLCRDDEDRRLLLTALREAARQHGLAVHAYALSTDHLHLLATPQTENALSLVMQALGRRYVSAYNRRHGRQGGLWVGRYRCAVLDPAQYLLDAMVFVEQHGVRAGRVTDPGDDGAASAAHHLGLRTDPLITDHVVFWTLGNTPFEREAAWRQRLAQGLTAARLQELAQAMRTGWALMSAEQAGKLEQAIGRRLMRRSRGRPRKAT